MDKKLPMCYEKGYCSFCKVENCDKRVKSTNYMSNKKCDGNCYECSKAVRSSFYCKLYGLDGFGERFNGCLMYHYFSEIQSFEFYGRSGKINDYSKIELVILQLKRCYECEVTKRYFRLLEEISSRIEKIPTCFESMTELTSTKTLKTTYNCISEILEKNFECKIKIVLKRLVKEFIDSNENEEVDLNELCNYITSKQNNINYYIHPLTIKPILDEIEKEVNNLKI